MVKSKNEKCTKILSCPFCKSNAEIDSTTFGDSSIEYYRVRCIKGHALDEWQDTEIEAIKSWNQRK